MTGAEIQALRGLAELQSPAIISASEVELARSLQKRGYVKVWLEHGRDPTIAFRLWRITHFGETALNAQVGP